MEEVISLLNLGSNDEIRMVGIHGFGGIGKTTLAVAVYNSIASQFQGSCYLENVRENFVKKGLTYLQKIILSKTVGEKNIELTSFREGITEIKKRLGQKKILLLLDDVDKAEQLEAIAGSPSWFGRGSRVIITTRNTRLLTCHEVESKYEVKLLNKEDAFELLIKKALRTNEVTPSYKDVLNRALTYASGLPLALEVIGSHLFKKTVEECKCVLDRYEKILDLEIQTILKVSYDALVKEEKHVFLDIACVFKGRILKDVEKILHAHYGDSKKHHIDVLVEKSLIKISEFSQVTLHDLIADMGEEIVRQKSPDDPGRRSRLWLAEDIVQVLEENQGTSNIEIIYFDSNIEVKWNGEAFKKMDKLKTLIIRSGASLKSAKHIPNSLRVLEWWDYTGDILSEFYPKKLVLCKFFGNFTSFMREDFFKKKFEFMRILEVGHCDFLTQIPDISGLLNLEEFSLKWCYNLIRIDDSVGLLDKLRTLSLIECWKLKSIPPLKLPSLEELHISCCLDLESFQPIGDVLLGKLRILRIDYCSKLHPPNLNLLSLEELHFDVCDGLDSFPIVVDGSLSKLKKLSFIYCDNLKSFPPLQLPSLESLILLDCPSLENFPSLDGLLGSLKFMKISKCNKIRSIPPLKLTLLEEFELYKCNGLESFPLVLDVLMGNLKILRVKNCRNIKSIPPLKLPLLEELTLSYCDSLESFSLVMDGSLGKLKSLRVEYCRKLKSFLQLKLVSLEKLHLSCWGSLESFLPLVDGWMGKLKVLKVVCCRNHRSIPAIRFASLKVLVLSCDCCYDTIHNIEKLHWDDTPLKELPFSFQDLNCLETLYLRNCGIVQFPTSSIGAMSKQDKDEEKVIPIQSSRVEVLWLRNCKLSDESLAIGRKLFANVKELDLSFSNFTTLPECIKNCPFLGKLVMDYCEKLQEIKGIPPNVKTISAFNCSSLTWSCTSNLLNQELHKSGNTNFILPGVVIPNWFDSKYMQGLAPTFWFRNKFPSIVLCVVFPMTFNNSIDCLKVTINGMENFYADGIHVDHYVPKMSHLWLFQMQNQNFDVDPDIELLENKWNHAVIEFEFGIFKSGIHVLKEISSIEDIRFDNPENDVSM